MTSVPQHAIFVSVITFSKGALLTLPRKKPPYKGFYQLPEGPVKKGERLEDAAIRVLRDASGLTGTKMKLIGIYDDVDTGERRIPNRRSYIISYLAMNWTGEVPLEGVRWMSDWRGEKLAFEHSEMLIEADSVLDMATKSRYLYAIK